MRGDLTPALTGPLGRCTFPSFCRCSTEARSLTGSQGSGKQCRSSHSHPGVLLKPAALYPAAEVVLFKNEGDYFCSVPPTGFPATSEKNLKALTVALRDLISSDFPGFSKAATVTSLLFKCDKHGRTSGPRHLLFPLPGTSFPVGGHGLSPLVFHFPVWFSTLAASTCHPLVTFLHPTYHHLTFILDNGLPPPTPYSDISSLRVRTLLLLFCAMS